FDTNNETNIKMGVNASVSDEIVNALPSDKVDIEKYDAPSSIKDTIVDSDLDVYIEQKGPNLEVTYKNEDPSLTGSTKQLLASAIQKNKMQDMTNIVEKIPDNMKQG
ncbi:ABC transporter permease, partial [Staphylococcus equorum]